MYEEWRDIKKYEGKYQVSNLGRVRSIDRTEISSNGRKRKLKGRLLKLNNDHYGYYQVCLCSDNKKRTFKVHRLVADAFVRNQNNLPMVNHKNEIKTDNKATNLEWCTSEYNANYGSRNRKLSDMQLKRKVVGTCLITGEKKLYDSISETKKDGFTFQSVSLCCYGKRLKKHKGYKWEFADAGEDKNVQQSS